MGKSEYALPRAARPRARPRLKRGALLTMALAGMLVLVGTHDGGERLRRVGDRVSVPAAEASTQAAPEPSDERVRIVSVQVVGPDQAPEIWATPLRSADGSAVKLAVPVAPALPAPPPTPAPAMAEAPVATPARAASTGNLFEPASLVGGPLGTDAGTADTPLRTTTGAALPLDDVPAILAAEPQATKPVRVREAATPRLAGRWAANAAGCRRRNTAFIPLVIDGRGARAGGSSCAFGQTRQTGNRWAVAATCRSGQETWAAHVKLTVEGRRLTWSSERGTETYTRCQ